MNTLTMARKKKELSPNRQLAQAIIDQYHPQSVEDMQDALKDIFGPMFEAMLQGEMNSHLDYSNNERGEKETANRRNGYSKKTLKTTVGDVPIEVPRDRDGTFEPAIVPKRKRDVSDIQDKVLSMYAKGMSQRDIADTIEDIYGFEISHETISEITDSVLEQLEEWQNRPLKRFYTFLFVDCLYVAIRKDYETKNYAVYVILGYDVDGQKDILGLWLSESESKHQWMQIFDELKNRGVEDILIACVDGLTGFPQAIEAVFPQTEIQQCIIHQIRNTTKFVSYKEIKPLMADLKRVYAAPTEEIALAELESFDGKWSGKYPKIAKSWKDNWTNLSTYFKYPEAVRRLIYTTNTIEGFNRQLRKVTKSRTVFPSDDSLLKMLYLAMMDITKKWTGHRQDWGQIHSQLEIFFEERLSGL